MFHVALFDSERDSKPKLAHVSWDTILKELTNPARAACTRATCAGKDCPHKRGPAWSPTHYRDGSERGNAGVLGLSLAVYDLDDLPDHRPLVGLLKALGLTFALHTTHTAGRWRLVLPLAREVPASAWPATWRAIGEALGIKPDAARKDLAGLYYWPSCPIDATFECVRESGQLLEPPIQAAVTTATVAASVPVAGPPVNLDAARQALRDVRKPESAALALTILAGEPLGAPGERDTNINKAASLVATACPGDLPVEAALEILRASIANMETAPEGLEHWLAKARYSFERAQERRAHADAKDAELRAAMGRVLKVGEKTVTTSDPTPDDWEKHLVWLLDRDGQPANLKPIGANAGLILEFAPEWRGQIRFNEVTKEITVSGGPLSAVPKASLDVEASNWLARSRYQLCLQTHVVGEQILAVARKNSFDPLRDYLLGLKWDRRKRMNSFLTHYYNAKGHPEYLRSVGRAWLISAVARALSPGCQNRTVLVLQGKQNVGKSKSLLKLGREFFSDTKLDVHDKDSRMRASCFWIIEISELAGFKNATQEALKAFFSASSDHIRPPYGRVTEQFLRRCVFVGTTNNDEFLNDPTGNTRYWPVRVGEVKVDELEAERDLIWAEAVEAYQAGEQYWLDADMAELQDAATNEVQAQNPKIEPILKHWLNTPPERRKDWVKTLTEVAQDILDIPPERLTHSLRIEIGYALSHMGFLRQRVRQGQTLVWVYKPSEALLEVEYRPSRRPTHLEVAK